MTVYGFGEVLLRYTPPNYEQLKDANTLGVNVGGAELNALVTLAQFGHATEMLTALPNHALGQLALQKMYQSRVVTQLIQHVDGRMETYYMEESFGFRSGKVIYDREHSPFAEQGHVVMDDVSIKAGDYVILTGITLSINETIDFATKCAVLQHTTNEDALAVDESDVFKLASHFGELKR